MKKRLTFVHLFILNQLVTTLVLLTVLGVYGTYIFVQEQRALRERMEPASAREADRINLEFQSLEANVERLKSIVELFEIMPVAMRVEKFRQFASATIAGHSAQFNAYFALSPSLAKEYFGKTSYVYVVHRDFSLFSSPSYNDPATFRAEMFSQPGYDKDPEQHWWWINEGHPGINYSDFYFDTGYMEKVMFSTTTGIYRNGNLAAVVGIDTLARDIAHRLDSFKLGETGGAVIVDEHGRPVLTLIAKDLPMLDFKYSRALSQADFKAMPKLSQKVFDIQAPRQLQEFTGSDGKTYLTYSRPLNGKSWHLVIYQEKSEAYSGLYFRLFLFCFVALVGYGVFTVMVWMTGKYVIAQDRKVLAELKESKERAEEATRIKSLFLSTMSHEIRTPLNAILGSAELLSETSLHHEQKEHLTSLQSAGDTLLSMLNNILDFSKFESGRMQLENREFLLSDLVREVNALIATSLVRKNLQFTLHHPEYDRWIIGDSLRLKQVLMNLLGNAVKFTDRGAVELTVQPYPGKEEGKEILYFEVKDTGIGIASENLKRIFDEFGQEDSSVTRRYGGTGLGLSISQKIVRLMGGELYCESRQFVGSRFYFSVQLASRQAELWSSRFALEAKSVASGEASPRPANGGHRHVLIVDDMEENHMLLKAYLKHLDSVTVESAYNGHQCIEMWERMHFDLIFMDVQMPRISGLDTIRKLRELERAYGRERTPIVVISANSFVEDVEKSLSAGADEHCGKPIRKQTFLEIVQKYCNWQSDTVSGC